MQKLFPHVKPFIQMHIFCNKQLATVWIKICVNCNFIDNRVICYIKTQLKYPSLSKLSYRCSNFNKNVLFRKPKFNGLFFFSATLCTDKKINKEKQNRLPLATSCVKFSATMNFLFTLSSLQTFSKQRHILRYDDITIQNITTEQPMWN